MKIGGLFRIVGGGTWGVYSNTTISAEVAFCMNEGDCFVVLECVELTKRHTVSKILVVGSCLSGYIYSSDRSDSVYLKELTDREEGVGDGNSV